MIYNHVLIQPHLVLTWSIITVELLYNMIKTLRPRQNGRRFTDDTFQGIFLNENVKISIKISLKFVLKGQINNIPALVQIMAWRRPGDKPLSETMMVRLETLICVTRPQWVNLLKLSIKNTLLLVGEGQVWNVLYEFLFRFYILHFPLSYYITSW